VQTHVNFQFWSIFVYSLSLIPYVISPRSCSFPPLKKMCVLSSFFLHLSFCHPLPCPHFFLSLTLPTLRRDVWFRFPFKVKRGRGKLNFWISSTFWSMKNPKRSICIKYMYMLKVALLLNVWEIFEISSVLGYLMRAIRSTVLET